MYQIMKYDTMANANEYHYQNIKISCKKEQQRICRHSRLKQTKLSIDFCMSANLCLFLKWSLQGNYMASFWIWGLKEVFGCSRTVFSTPPPQPFQFQASTTQFVSYILKAQLRKPKGKQIPDSRTAHVLSVTFQNTTALTLQINYDVLCAQWFCVCLGRFWHHSSFTIINPGSIASNINSLFFLDMARYPLRLPITWRQSSYHHLSSRSIRPKNYPTTTTRLFIGLHIVHGVIDPSIYIYIHIHIIIYIYISCRLFGGVTFPAKSGEQIYHNSPT